MNITIGIDKITDITPLSNLGVNEFFCGVIDKSTNGFSNHRPNNNQFNLSNITDLERAIDITHKNKKKIFLALNDNNSHYQHNSQLIKKIQTFDQLNLDGIIINDLSTLVTCKQIKVKTNIHLSSLAICLNSETINFYKKLNVKRIILPHQITPKEYKSIQKNISTNTEVEIFFQKYNACIYIDGLCRYHSKGPFTPTATMPWRLCSVIPKITTANKSDEIYLPKISSLFKNHLPPLDYFGNLYEFNLLKVKQIKLGTRGYPIDKKIEITKYISELIELLNHHVSKKVFCNLAKKIESKYKNINL